MGLMPSMVSSFCSDTFMINVLHCNTNTLSSKNSLCIQIDAKEHGAHPVLEGVEGLICRARLRIKRLALGCVNPTSGDSRNL